MKVPNTDDIYLVLTYAAQSAATTVRFDAFAFFDTVLDIENGTAYVKF